MQSRRLLALAAMATVAVLMLSGAIASAHTEPDVIAIAAGGDATVVLKPNHGCGDSPSTKVSTRVPVSGARGGQVDGWVVTQSEDGEGRTVIDWTGGSLPSDQTGAFPIEFTAPATPGTILTFPFVQECANGEDLAWIDGDPAGEYPAPRLLILPPGSEAATTIDDVPVGVPGRDQLVAILDVDDVASSTTSTTAPESSTTVSSVARDKAADEDESSSLPLVVGGAGLVAVIIAALAWRRRANGT
jgi:uncharacterized protein YcnI